MNNRWIGLALVLVMGFVLPGCFAKSPEEYYARDFGELGANIYAQPDRAEKLLKAAGFTEEQFIRELKRISQDPKLAKRYRWAFERRLRSLGEIDQQPYRIGPETDAPPAPGGGSPGGF